MNRRGNPNIWLAAFVLTMTLAAPAGAVTHHVSPGQSIQAAINAASNGDQIAVAPGTYNEAIDFKGKAVRLYSSGGPDVTTIDGTGHYHVVQCRNAEGPDTILEGFTITGGIADGSGSNGYGGGMYCYNSSPTVSNCTFNGNLANDDGGGMRNDFNSYPVLTNCTFSGNMAGSAGGGMLNYVDSSPMVANCTFVANVSGTAGGGICNLYNSSPIVTNCILWGDMPDEIYDAEDSAPLVSYSDIEGGYTGAANIVTDPCFVDTYNPDSNLWNLRLRPGSSCIDAGNNDAPSLADTDYDGHPRIIDGNCDDSDVVDMGVHEFNYAYMGDLDYSCRVDFLDFSVLAPAWMTQAGDPD